MDRLRSFGLLRAVSDGEMTVDAVIATGDIARDDAIIDPAGWDFSNYNRNPVVLVNHDDFGGLPVARTVEGSLQASDSELRARAQFDAEDPDAVRLFGKISRGFVNATSVRWLPRRWEYVEMGGESGQRRREVLVFREQELLEWSFVSIPADPGAVILRSDHGDPIDLTHYGVPAEQISRTQELLRLLDDQGVDAVFDRLDEDERELVERLTRTPVAPVVETPPAPTPARSLSGIGDVVTSIERLASRRSASPEDIAIAAIARATGRSETLVREQMRTQQGG